MDVRHILTLASVLCILKFQMVKNEDLTYIEDIFPRKH